MKLLCRCRLLPPCLAILWISFAGTASAIETAESPAPAVLTSASAVRGLSEAEARKGVPVRLRGVLLGEADPDGIAFVVHDGTEAIYVQGPAEQVAGLERGDLLEMEGVSEPGGFAPFVLANRISKVGTAEIPPPLVVSINELNAGRLDAVWVEFSGIVRSIEPKAPSDMGPPPPGTRHAIPNEARASATAGVKMKVAQDQAHVIVEVRGAIEPEKLVDAEVRFRGLCFNLHNRKRQFVRPFVQVPLGVEVVVEQSPPADPFSGEPRPVESLLQFEQLAGKHGHREHVRGVVLYHRPGKVLWIRDRAHSLRVESVQDDVLEPGDEVDVAGFLSRGEYSPVLQDAIYRRRSSGPAPQPRPIADVVSGVQEDGDLVEVPARVADVRRIPDNIVLTLDFGGVPIRAQMHLPDEAAAPADWLPDSMVRAAGVCAVVTGEAVPLGGLWEPQSFQLLLRSPADVSIVQPAPWMNAERVVWVLSGFLACAVGGVAVVMRASRLRLKEQDQRRAMAEAEFTAILSERNRVAREIHDTLSQSLGAISVQLELARVHAKDIGPPVRQHLATAQKLTRGALSEARESIWNMRSQVLERHDLGEALEAILKQVTEGTPVAPQIHVTGTRRRLPPAMENNLLRIGQEAITNAGKHARASCIRVTLTFERRVVRLEVEDDGVGFVPDAQPAGDARSFGLVGIKERAELIGGAVEIRSAPGCGTRVVASVST